MRRFVFVMMASLLFLPVLRAQDDRTAQQGDPPIAALITVSAPDDAGIVTLTGAPGAVFPNAQVAIRNLYTEDLVYVQSGFNGAFSARLYGPGRTPFWVSPAATIPQDARNRPGSLPGGPGTIVYGSSPQPRVTSAPSTQLMIDGQLDDWAAYPAPLGEVLALRNQESVYVGFSADTLPDYARLRLNIVLDAATYSITLDPRLPQAALAQQLLPTERDLGTLGVAAIQAEAIEIRIPLSALDDSIETAQLNRIQLLGADDTILENRVIEQDFPFVDEVDGVIFADPLPEEAPSFFAAGALSQGGSEWTARGRVNTTALAAGDEWILQLRVQMNVPELPRDLVGLRMIGRLALQPVIDAHGRQSAGGLHSLNGYSTVLTSAGLPIENIRSDFFLGEAVSEPQALIRRGDSLLFGMVFRLNLPADLPPGMYVPIFTGWAQIGDSDLFQWDDNAIFAVPGPGLSRSRTTPLPVVLNVGQIASARLLWALFYDQPSDGSRGILPDEDAAFAALSNRVRFNSPTYILPPGTYPLEPYLPGQMPGLYDSTAAPLLPLLLPGGRLNVQVTRPDGTLDDLGSTAIAQVQFSTDIVDERLIFGRGGPVDTLRLSTLNPNFSRYSFDQYGRYTLKVEGNIEDVQGMRYDGGGTYHVLIAESLDLTPAALPGTPFEVGNWMTLSAHLSPDVPADVTVRLRVYPLGGSEMIEETISGQANRYGFFYGGAFQLETAGQYVIDYEARYTDPAGKLWAASLRGAGLIARGDSGLIARGRRGVADDPGIGAAWFHTAVYPPDDDSTPPRPNFPYFTGDVAWIEEGPRGGMRPVIDIQDAGGAYTNWLTGVHPASAELIRLSAEGRLPLFSLLGGPPTLYSPALLPDLTVNQAYALISAVRPDVSVRQFVQGTSDPALPLHWDGDDPLNQQIGAGTDGLRPGDVIFLFGGAYINNAEAEIRETAIYASVAVMVDGEESRARVFPPYSGQSGGASGGPLLTVRGQEVEMFFHPTGARPGQVLLVGDPLTVAGQLAPTLPSTIHVTVTSPSGGVRQFAGSANAIGYFHDPANDFSLDEPGVWTVQIQAEHSGMTSVGMIEAPAPRGGVLGTVEGRFQIYVVAPDSPALIPAEGQQSIDAAARPGLPINFNFDLPENWTNVQVYHTVSTSTYLLEEGLLRSGQDGFSYQYNPVTFSREFANLESDNRNAGPAASDVVTLTFVITGLDQDGDFEIRARSYTLRYDRLLSLEAVIEE